MSREDRTPIPSTDLAHLQCHVLDPDDDTTTLCGLSGKPLLVFLSDEVRLDDVSCLLCKQKADQERFMAKITEGWVREGTMAKRPSAPDLMPLLVVFGLSGFFSTIFFPWITALLVALLAVVGTLLLLPSRER